MSSTLDIIIVNWNAGSLLQDCLHSIEGTTQTGFKIRQVVIVDNGSTDGSLDGLEFTDLPLKIIKNTDNKGFAAACNQGAQGSRADYLLFLNPDTRLFADSLSVPLAFMEVAQNQSVGICGIQLIDEYEEVSRSCARFPTPRMFYSKIFGLDRLFPGFFKSHFMEEWGHDENREVDHVIGAFFLVRRHLFEQLNGFDERFFVYLEDLDLSLRAKKLGWSSYYLADAQAYHKGGGTSAQVKARRLFYSLRSRALYGYKHFTPTQATLLLVSTLCFEPLTRLVFSLLRGAFKSTAETLSGYLMLYRALPGIMTAIARKLGTASQPLRQHGCQHPCPILLINLTKLNFKPMNSNLRPSPISLTHQHLFSCLNTLMPEDAQAIRILDAGCGDGKLMSFIHNSLKFTHPNLSVEIYGFDVVDHGVQTSGFLNETIAALSSDIPAIDWSERIKFLRIGDPWGFPDNSFDIVLSNQVFEHVHDKPFFFSEAYRVLRDGGYAVHLAPLVHYIYEGHLHLPWVHRIRSHDFLYSYISFMSLLGFGKYRSHNKITGITRSEFSKRHADYVYFWTNYSSESEMLNLARTAKFRASFRFSADFYFLKLRQLFRLPYKANYKASRSALFDSLAIKFLRYLSSVTFVCEKRNTYK